MSILLPNSAIPRNENPTKRYARIAKLSIAITPLAASTAQGRAAA